MPGAYVYRKDAKKASKGDNKVVKKNASNKLAKGGRVAKAKTNEPSYPSYEQFKDMAAKQGFNSDSTIYRHNPQNIRGVMSHNGVPADSVGVWSGRINRELSGVAANNRTNKYGNKISGTISDNGELNVKKKGGKLSKKSPSRKFKCGGKMKKK